MDRAHAPIPKWRNGRKVSERARFCAVVIYNVFARSIAGYRAALGDAAAAVLRLVSRDLDRAAGVPLERAAGEPVIGRRVRLADASGGPRGSS
jgi:hypothetical protein